MNLFSSVWLWGRQQDPVPMWGQELSKVDELRKLRKLFAKLLRTVEPRWQPIVILVLRCCSSIIYTHLYRSQIWNKKIWPYTKFFPFHCLQYYSGIGRQYWLKESCTEQAEKDTEFKSSEKGPLRLLQRSQTFCTLQFRHQERQTSESDAAWTYVMGQFTHPLCCVLCRIIHTFGETPGKLNLCKKLHWITAFLQITAITSKSQFYIVHLIAVIFAW